MERYFLFLSLLFLCCCAHQEASQGKKPVRSDVVSWIEKNYGDSKETSAILMNMASIGIADCKFKIYSKCLENLRVSDSWLIEVKLIEKMLDHHGQAKLEQAKTQHCPKNDEEEVRSISCY